MSFVHLHTHSHYSLLDGVAKIPELIAAAKKMRMPAIALTDHGNLYGAIEFYREAKANGLKPIIGCEFYIAPSGITEKKPKERPYHLVVLARNNEGYRHLIKLVTLSHLEGFYGKPRVDDKMLQKYNAGLIALSGCRTGEIARAILRGNMAQAEQTAKKYAEIFGHDHFFLEMQHQPNASEQAKVNQGLAAIAHKLNLELVATNDAHYLDLVDAEAQDILVCIQTKKLLSDQNRLSMRAEDYSLRSPKQMAADFSAYPSAVTNTLKIADMINLELKLGSLQLPHYDLPADITPEQKLTEICEQGLQRRYGAYAQVHESIKQRLEYELSVIKKTGFASYFLIVQDFINWAKKQGIAVGPGRGSAAGSIVAYLSNITDVDPIRYNLLFERFLNPERVSMPDIDSDFADTRRDEVISYVEQKYGKDHVAQIITFGTMAARAAVRDVGRVMGLSYGYCDRLAKMIPMFTSLDAATRNVVELRELIQNDPDTERLIVNAKKLEGVARHTSTHACAVVVTKEPLEHYMPVQYVDQNDRTIVTQYSMIPVDQLGLLKIDLLGLKNLTIIESAIKYVEQTTGKKIDITQIPLSDKTTFALLQRADTIGVFQLESSGMRRYLKQLKPTDIEDIIAMVSLYRPGPMEFIPDYIAGKHSKRQITYLDARLKPILEKTFGIAVYQEQVSEIARRLAGFSYGEADVLRKAVAKKIKSLLDEQEEKLIKGMVQNGLTRSAAQKIWEFILPFARYGFNRSHAACYALIAYRTAYLKAHFPAHFMAALLTADNSDTDRIAIEIKQTRAMGISVLPPDINESWETFRVVTDDDAPHGYNIRFGLMAIKNVGGHLVERIVAEREGSGQKKFTSLENFLQRVQDKDLNKKSLESLIKVGAMDSFGERQQLLINIEVLLQFAKRAQLDASSGQENIFAAMPQTVKITLEPSPPAAHAQKLKWEKELIGLYISGHPLQDYEHLLSKSSIPFNTLSNVARHVAVNLVGVITSVKKIYTKKGDPMLFVGLQDYTAEIEAIVFPSTYKDTAALWQEDVIVLVCGKIDDQDGEIKVIVETGKKFDINITNSSVMKQKIIVTTPPKIPRAQFTALQRVLETYPGDYQVSLDIDGKTMETRRAVSTAAIEQITEIFGQKSVRVVK